MALTQTLGQLSSNPDFLCDFSMALYVATPQFQ